MVDSVSACVCACACASVRGSIPCEKKQVCTTVGEMGNGAETHVRACRHRLKKRSYRRRLTENDCFGESILLIGDKLYFNMVAEEDAVMLELSKRAFNHFIQQHTRVVPELGSFLALQLVEASEDVDEDMASDLTTDWNSASANSTNFQTRLKKLKSRNEVWCERSWRCRFRSTTPKMA